MVKQNMADVVVFAGVLGLVSWGMRVLRFGDLWRLVVRFTAGGTLAVAAVLGMAQLHGTSPGEVLFAMYAFRLRATSIVNASLSERLVRLQGLGQAELLTAAPLLVVALLLVLVLVRLGVVGSRPAADPLRSAVAVATLLLTAYGVVSVIAGGSYWLHYLVELVVPTALAGGLLVSLVPRPGRLLVAVVLVAAAIAWPIGLTKRVSASGQVVGSAVGRVTQPGDTMVSVFGDPDIPRSAGLESPYPYLWSLPARTLDRHFRRLGAVLAGPRAPTWFVARGPTTLTTLDRAGPGAVLRARYRQVGDVCGRMIYLRNGVTRQAPVAPGGCTQLMSTWLDGGSP
jgi:hypothetical protein